MNICDAANKNIYEAAKVFLSYIFYNTPPQLINLIASFLISDVTFDEINNNRFEIMACDINTNQIYTIHVPQIAVPYPIISLLFQHLNIKSIRLSDYHFFFQSLNIIHANLHGFYRFFLDKKIFCHKKPCMKSTNGKILTQVNQADNIH